MIYAYTCSCGETTNRDFPMGQAAGYIGCGCGRTMRRDYGSANIQPTNDAFRRYHLSSKKETEQVRQKRVIEGPRDKSEAKVWEQATGRIYIGDDTSGMSAKAQKAIAHGKGKE